MLASHCTTTGLFLSVLMSYTFSGSALTPHGENKSDVFQLMHVESHISFVQLQVLAPSTSRDVATSSRNCGHDLCVLLPLSGHDRQSVCHPLLLRSTQDHLWLPVAVTETLLKLMKSQMAPEFFKCGPESCAIAALLRQHDLGEPIFASTNENIFMQPPNTDSCID